jgi:hypothetical protein
VERTLGYLAPIYKDPETGLVMLRDEHMEQLVAGYGCPNCLQGFDMIHLRCPVCSADLSRPFDEWVGETPPEWLPGPDDPDYKWKPAPTRSKQ